MKNTLAKKIAVLLVGGVAMMATSAGAAHPIRTPEGNLPMIHWAVVESTPGEGTSFTIRIPRLERRVRQLK